MKTVAILRWAARILGVASTLLLLAFAFGGRENLQFTTPQALAFLLFPVGVIAGFVVAWWNELAGGLITLGSVVLFYLFLFALSGRWPGGPYFLLFAAPGVLHLACALLDSRKSVPSAG